MVMVSWSVTLTCVTVTIAFEASVRRDSPATLALALKLESHTASSPGDMGGMSAGGDAGSKVRVAKMTGSFTISGPGASAGGRCEGMLRHKSEPKTIATSSMQRETIWREDKTTSTSYFPDKDAPGP